MSLFLGVHPTVKPTSSEHVVKEVRCFVVGSKEEEESAGGGADCHSQVRGAKGCGAWGCGRRGVRGGEGAGRRVGGGGRGGCAQASGHWIVDTPIANPMSVYQEYKTSRRAWGINALGTVVVEVETASGHVGVGVTIGGEPAAYIVEHHLSRFVEGQDPHNVELIWDQMFRGSVNYGRKGLVIQAISAVDLALWDVIGKIANKPVYQLLGGKTKDRLPVYATTARPDLAKGLGFVGGKLPLPYGPADGDAGMRENIARIKAVREAVGPDFPIMVDCYMSLTVPYTIELVRRIDREVPGGVKWVEEFLPPDDYEGYAEVKRVVGDKVLLTTGEHEYTRWGFRQLLEKKCCDVLQPDITWCGGITEARRIVALAAAFDTPVIPHGSSVYSYHLQYAFANCPIAEFLILSPKGDTIVPLFGGLFTDEPLPKDGYIDLPDRPGFGVTLNREGLALRRPYARRTPSVADIAAAKAARSPLQTEWLARAERIPVTPVADDAIPEGAAGRARGPSTAAGAASGGGAAAAHHHE
jgi:L-rhamnonate dehydratase